MSLPTGQAALALFYQAEETAWLSFAHASHPRCRVAAEWLLPLGPPPCTSPRARPGSSLLGAVPSMLRGGMWPRVSSTHVTLSPQPDLGRGPGFPGSLCRPAGPSLRLWAARPGLLPALAHAGEKLLWAVGCAPLRSIRRHVLTSRCFCDSCNACLLAERHSHSLTPGLCPLGCDLSMPPLWPS